jgi:hypothetical protein
MFSTLSTCSPAPAGVQVDVVSTTEQHVPERGDGGSVTLSRDSLPGAIRAFSDGVGQRNSRSANNDRDSERMMHGITDGRRVRAYIQSMHKLVNQK